ncbi:MAG: HNH endonuclease [Nanoarchaeota archaeon]
MKLKHPRETYRNREWMKGRKGIISNAWKGGEYKDNWGYIWIYNPEHPNNRNNYIRKHRLIMEQYIDRYLTEDEHIHHINGIKDDNRIDNLQIVNIKEHGSLEGRKAKGIPKLTLRKEPIKKSCIYCKNEFIIKRGYLIQKFCSYNCYSKFSKGKTKKEVRNYES